jgi:putative nucleotidyltransferase with HDIG domain
MITTADVETLFAGVLDLIEDADLKKKTVAAWVTGCEQGGWDSVETLSKMPFTLLTDCKGVTFLEHTVAVTLGAYALAKAQIDTYESVPYPIDLDRVVAGGILHDVGKLLEIEPDGEGGYRKSRNGMCARHPISGAILVAQAGLPEEIVNTVACHAKEGDGRPQVVETVFIHQADFATFNPLVMQKAGKLIE